MQSLDALFPPPAMTAVRGWMQRRLLALASRRAEPFSQQELRAPAIVFAPHPDDETLGCGGTILRKRVAGAAVSIVFMTADGLSQPGRMDRKQLGAIREAEGLAAAAKLGVDPAAVRFHALEEGAVDAKPRDTVAAIVEELVAREPAQVFVPFRDDGHADHRATYLLVRAALRKARRQAEILEYPVWRWRHWPWVPLAFPLRPRPKTAGAGEEWSYWVRSAELGLGLRFALSLNRVVDVSATLDGKRAALAEHRSQTVRLSGRDDWWTLADVCEGEWARWFFEGREWFRRSVHGDG